MSNETELAPKLASFRLIARRFGAAVIDLVAFGAVAAAASTAGFGLVRPRGWDGLIYAFWFSMLGFGLAVVVQAWSHWKKGGTLGQRSVRITVIRNGMLADPVIRLVHWLLAFAGPIGAAAIAALLFDSLSGVPVCAALAIASNLALLISTGRAFNDFLLGVTVQRSQPTFSMHL